ncbi:hypothetical protein GQ42DRAFT_64350 [Ramicandelaber brevisporus]|nr:hypothetical protein GQ42DRAFT_68529 [Ramicandelaber brevisporus]KAI8866954.1 hypothetical protein GQ42DRAFT_64350 [Ramicandelaber brevisporus]
MKVLTDEEWKTAENVYKVAGAKGLVYGTGIAIPAIILGNKYLPGFNRLTMAFRGFIASSIIAAGFIINAEREGNAWEAKRMNYQNKIKPESLTLKYDNPTDKAMAWIAENRWPLIGGTWVAGMAATGARLWRNTTYTTTQKIVEARMIAQGLTIGTLLLTAAIVTMERERDKKLAKARVEAEAEQDEKVSIPKH